jgi:uncharacterized protein
MNSDILLDSSFLAALYNSSDQYHRLASGFVKLDKSVRIIPEVTLPEVSFLLNRARGVPAKSAFIKAIVRARPTLQNLTWDDIARAETIMVTYARANFDLVDCCIMALSERLDIRRVATFDRRDFPMFRPSHCDYLELVP